MYLCVGGIDFASFYDFDILFWNRSDSVVFCFFSIGTVLTVWYFVIFHGWWNCPDSVILCYFSIRTVLTVWYFVIFLLELS